VVGQFFSGPSLTLAAAALLALVDRSQ